MKTYKDGLRAGKETYKYDRELEKTVRVVESEDEYKDLIKDYSVERIARKGDNFITQNTNYNVSEIEPDYDFTVYKYIHDGKEYFSNFKFANPVEIIEPKTKN